MSSGAWAQLDAKGTAITAFLTTKSSTAKMAAGWVCRILIKNELKNWSWKIAGQNSYWLAVSSSPDQGLNNLWNIYKKSTESGGVRLPVDWLLVRLRGRMPSALRKPPAATLVPGLEGSGAISVMLTAPHRQELNLCYGFSSLFHEEYSHKV